MWISFFRQKQRKPHTVVPLVILGALQLEDLSAFAGVLWAWQLPVHVNNCSHQCRCSTPAITAEAAWPRILRGQDGEEKSVRISVVQRAFHELLHEDTVHLLK